jgi:hypothetical protein
MPRSGVAEARRELDGRRRRDRSEFERHLREAESYQDEVTRYRERVSRRRVSGPARRPAEHDLDPVASRQPALAVLLDPEADDVLLYPELGEGEPSSASDLGGPGRRETVTITGQGAEGYASRHGTRPSSAQRHLQLRPHERAGFQPDRVAMWAVFLGVLLVVMATATAHA